jgi:hypothetical protein
VNDVADVEQPNSRDPVEGRHQFGVAELGFGIFDRCLIGFDNRLFLGDLRLLRGELLLGCIPLLCKRLIAAEVDPPIFEMGRVAGEIGRRLIELCLIGAPIELGKELALLIYCPSLKSILMIGTADVARFGSSGGLTKNLRVMTSPGTA